MRGVTALTSDRLQSSSVLRCSIKIERDVVSVLIQQPIYQPVTTQFPAARQGKAQRLVPTITTAPFCAMYPSAAPHLLSCVCVCVRVCKA